LFGLAANTAKPNKKSGKPSCLSSYKTARHHLRKQGKGFAMEYNNQRYNNILMVLAVLVLASLSCSFFGVNLQTRTANITVTLHEDDINRLMINSNENLDDNDVLLRKVTGIDMNEGYRRVSGTYEKANGSEATGSYDLAVRAEEGALKAEITGVDIEGVELGDRRISRLNEELSESLARSARESKGEVEFESVEITDDALTIRVKTHWEN
jgi:hypothetical protein